MKKDMEFPSANTTFFGHGAPIKNRIGFQLPLFPTETSKNFRGPRSDAGCANFSFFCLRLAAAAQNFITGKQKQNKSVSCVFRVETIHSLRNPARSFWARRRRSRMEKAMVKMGSIKAGSFWLSKKAKEEFGNITQDLTVCHFYYLKIYLFLLVINGSCVCVFSLLSYLFMLNVACSNLQDFKK